jgi:predicted DNA-binding ribbon-helix-helix protein
VKSSNRKHSVLIGGHRTSVSLEDDFWKSLRYIARGRGETLCDLLVKIDADRQSANLSSAIRMFVLRYYQTVAPLDLNKANGVSNSIEAR